MVKILMRLLLIGAGPSAPSDMLTNREQRLKKRYLIPVLWTPRGRRGQRWLQRLRLGVCLSRQRFCLGTGRRILGGLATGGCCACSRTTHSPRETADKEDMDTKTC